MIESNMSSDLYDDPRKLSAMIARAASLAGEHEVSSALVGMAAEEGDAAFPDYIAYLQQHSVKPADVSVSIRFFRLFVPVFGTIWHNFGTFFVFP